MLLCRFAAVRTLNKVAMKHPAAVTACNLDLENLITDVNRSIATLAITTLLKVPAAAIGLNITTVLLHPSFIAQVGRVP